MEYVLLQEPLQEDDRYKAPQIILKPKETEEDCEKIVCDYLKNGYIIVGTLESNLKIYQLMRGLQSNVLKDRGRYRKCIFEALKILAAMEVEDD